MEYGEHVIAQRPSKWRAVCTALLTLLVFLLVFWGMRTFIMQPYQIPSGSMENTIMIGDNVFSERVSYYFSEPQPGDIVTFDDPEMPGRILIKRVIATAGQTVSFVNGNVVVDGVVNNEPYVKGKSYPAISGTASTNIHYPYTVPEGELWVMGDNRENSQDSRFFGAIPVSSLTGKAFFIYWPLNQIGFI